MTAETSILTQARGLASAGRVADAVALLKSIGRLDVALDLRREDIERRPSSAVAEHNLAALLGDLGQASEAEATVRRAFAKGGDAPETWLVLARALVSQDRFEEADAAYREAIARRPTYADAVRDLAQLIWMRTGDPQAALIPFESALATGPGASDLRVARAMVMDYVGIAPEIILAALGADGRDADIERAAIQAAQKIDPDLALTHAKGAYELRPDMAAALQLAGVYLARGEGVEAGHLIDDVLAYSPNDQNALSLRAAAWRLDQDRRLDGLYDYSAMVKASTLDVPAPWTDLKTYLADLTQALRRLHRLTTHPIGQSLRHGTQTTASLLTSSDPAIQAFFTVIDRPIRAYIAELGEGDDPLRRLRRDDYRIAGAWSVQLQPGGFHVPHIHPQGWLSSACYIEVPDAVAGGGQEGWIGFGGPPFMPDLPHQHFVQPEPGRLVLFPSYMWHGTQVFGGDQPRLTIAFDVVPT